MVSGWYLDGPRCVFVRRMPNLSRPPAAYIIIPISCVPEAHEPLFESPPLVLTHPYIAVIGQKQMTDVPQEGRLAPNLSPNRIVPPGSRRKKKKRKKNSAAQRDIKQALQKGCSNLPGLLCWFFNRRTGEQRALSLRTRERRAAAFIMSCPDVMRPLYGHYAPHAPGAAAIVGNFPVSFPPLYSLETNQELFMCSPVFQFLKPDLLGQVRTKDTSQIRMFCTFTHLRILFVCLVYGSYIAYSTLCKVIYVKNT